MQSAPLPVLTTDSDGQLLQTNLADHDDLPRTLDRDLWEEQFPGMASAIDRTLEGSEYQTTTERGDRVWEVHGHPLAEHTDLAGAAIVAFDVTEWRRITKVRKEAQKEVERASRLKSAFLANPSHEIRTPMTAVLGSAELLQTTDLTDEQQERVDTIKESGEHLVDIVDHIGPLQDRGRAPVDRASAQVHRLPRRVVRPDGGGPRPQAGPGALLRDRRRCSQPRRTRPRAVPAGRREPAYECGQIHERVPDRPRRGTRPAGRPGTLAVEVTDTGGGIPDDEQAELFKAFTQVDSSATRVREEVGLGLSIVQELTRLMGGHVTCESTPGEGSTFRFTVEAPPVGSREPPTDSDPFLVAGDDGFEVDRIQALLEAWRIPHLVARDASEVRDVLDASDPRILVVDELLVDRAGGLFLSNLRDQLPETASIVRLGSFPEPSTEAGDATLAKSISAAAFHALLHDPDADLAMPSPDEARQLDPPFEVGDPGLKVLIAEDSPVNQQMLVAMLRRSGHEVQAVDGGSGAVEAVSRDSEIDLVLVDIQMPRMDGYEATERILDEHGDEALASWPSPPTPTRRPVAAAARRGWRAPGQAGHVRNVGRRHPTGDHRAARDRRGINGGARGSGTSRAGTVPPQWRVLNAAFQSGFVRPTGRDPSIYPIKPTGRDGLTENEEGARCRRSPA